MITFIYLIGLLFGWFFFTWLGLILVLIADAVLEG
jgi:hypothetical protein